MKKLIPILISIILFVGCSAGKSAESSGKPAESSVETPKAGTTSQTTVTTETTTSEISEDDVLLILEKAEELYKSSDGINGFEFQKVSDKYYQNGDVNKPTYEDVIAEYHKIFTDNVCQQIFSGKRKKGNTEYEIIPVYGFSSDGNYIKLDFFRG